MPTDPTPPEPARRVVTSAYRVVGTVDARGRMTSAAYEVIDGVARRVDPPPPPDDPPDEPFVVG
jgi:hypothetical protein